MPGADAHFIADAVQELILAASGLTRDSVEEALQAAGSVLDALIENTIRQRAANATMPGALPDHWPSLSPNGATVIERLPRHQVCALLMIAVDRLARQTQPTPGQPT